MTSPRHDRQGFLGPRAPEAIASTTVGVVGLGGGGSHIIQQLAHVGVQRFVVYDPDRIEDSNLNRLVGGTAADVQHKEFKVRIAERVIRAVTPEAHIEARASAWQADPDPLRQCDVVVGCVDGLPGREQLETFTRRHLQPYLDIGLDVVAQEGEPARMAGQVLLSMPGGPCMRCLGFFSAQDRPDYGDAGGRPQVVWANGVLASTAVGLLIDLLTGWTQRPPGPVYLSYDANLGTVSPHPRLLYLGRDPCPHFSPDQVGPPRFQPL